MSLVIEAEPIALQTDADGVARVGGTRVTLDVVIAAFNEGATAEEIAQQYPSLQLADVYDVIGYCLRHVDDIETYLLTRQKQAESVQRENLRRFGTAGVRERLLSRRAEKA
jgi:uncharacterized protein (DUF433 family)